MSPWKCSPRWFQWNGGGIQLCAGNPHRTHVPFIYYFGELTQKIEKGRAFSHHLVPSPAPNNHTKLKYSEQWVCVSLLHKKQVSPIHFKICSDRCWPDLLSCLWHRNLWYLSSCQPEGPIKRYLCFYWKYIHHLISRKIRIAYEKIRLTGRGSGVVIMSSCFYHSVLPFICAGNGFLANNV